MLNAPAIVVHGGAGEWLAPRHPAAREGCTDAVRVGLELLAAGAPALDAAQAAVRVLEDAPAFNAGIGAVLNRAGDVEMDAAVMDGEHLRFGAIAGVRNARQPIDIARAVLEDGEHVLLCADGVWGFARERGFEPCDPKVLITERARQRLAQTAAARRVDRTVDPGTVGAVAFDARGHVAAATSTGGTSYKRPGRVGDTAVCGAGTYADDLAGAVSATGHGESVIRATTSLHCANFMRAGRSAREAAWAAIDALGERVGGSGGVVCVDASGRLGAAHNTAAMAWGAGIVGRTEIVADVTIGRDAAILAHVSPATR